MVKEAAGTEPMVSAQACGPPRWAITESICGADLRSFTFCERPRGNFQEVTNGGMSILSDEYDRAVVVHRHDHGAARVMDHVALIGKLTFSDGVDRDLEHAAVEYFLTA